jgi:hypothetical protein
MLTHTWLEETIMPLYNNDNRQLEDCHAVFYMVSLEIRWKMCGYPMLCETLSPWHGMSLGCRLSRQPPDMEGS